MKNEEVQMAASKFEGKYPFLNIRRVWPIRSLESERMNLTYCRDEKGKVVEVAGIEPASEAIFLPALHV